MNPKLKNPKAIAFLSHHFYGLGENHPDYQEGIEAIKTLKKYIKGAEQMKAEWIGSLAEL